MVESEPRETFISFGDVTASAWTPNGEENVCGIQNIVCNIYHLITFYMYLFTFQKIHYKIINFYN